MLQTYLKLCRIRGNNSLKWTSSLKGAFLYECDGRAALENIIQFSGYHELFVTFQWLAFAFRRKALNYLVLSTDNDAISLKGFHGISVYSLVSSLKMTLLVIRHANSQSTREPYFILWHNLFATLFCWLHLILFMSPAITAQCLQSSLLCGFCLCQYLFVFGRIHSKKKSFFFFQLHALISELLLQLSSQQLNTPNWPVDDC